jgi:hypothetical protein
MSEYKIKTVVNIELEKDHVTVVVCEKAGYIDIQNYYNGTRQGNPYYFSVTMAPALIKAIQSVADSINDNNNNNNKE